MKLLTVQSSPMFSVPRLPAGRIPVLLRLASSDAGQQHPHPSRLQSQGSTDTGFLAWGGSVPEL